jgi:hypothetical protein
MIMLIVLIMNDCVDYECVVVLIMNELNVLIMNECVDCIDCVDNECVVVGKYSLIIKQTIFIYT